MHSADNAVFIINKWIQQDQTVSWLLTVHSNPAGLGWGGGVGMRTIPQCDKNPYSGMGNQPPNALKGWAHNPSCPPSFKKENWEWQMFKTFCKEEGSVDTLWGSLLPTLVIEKRESPSTNYAGALTGDFIPPALESIFFRLCYSKNVIIGKG